MVFIASVSIVLYKHFLTDDEKAKARSWKREKLYNMFDFNHKLLVKHMAP